MYLTQGSGTDFLACMTEPLTDHHHCVGLRDWNFADWNRNLCIDPLHGASVCVEFKEVCSDLMGFFVPNFTTG